MPERAHENGWRSEIDHLPEFCLVFLAVRFFGLLLFFVFFFGIFPGPNDCTSLCLFGGSRGKERSCVEDLR